jgi:hypothetical protein
LPVLRIAPDECAIRRLKRRVSNGEESAWEMFIERLSEGLTKACALREAVVTGAKTNESASEEVGQIIADVFGVVHYMPAESEEAQ